MVEEERAGGGAVVAAVHELEEKRDAGVHGGGVAAVVVADVVVGAGDVPGAGEMDAVEAVVYVGGGEDQPEPQVVAYEDHPSIQVPSLAQPIVESYEVHKKELQAYLGLE